MISKAFQDIVTQMAEVFPKRFGVVDSHGLVLASNGMEPSPDVVESLIYAATNNDRVMYKDGYKPYEVYYALKKKMSQQYQEEEPLRIQFSYEVKSR